jgi:hypothetical protein
MAGGESMATPRIASTCLAARVDDDLKWTRTRLHRHHHTDAGHNDDDAAPFTASPYQQ